MQFSAHNIELPGGERTRGSDEPLLKDTGICRATLRTLLGTFGARPEGDVRIADLGCLEGGYTVEFARAGFRALGIEGRETNFAKCRYVAERLRLGNLEFVRDDVRNLADYGTFDAIFCCGLLYHLDKPGAFIDLLGRCTRKLLVLQTHYAVEGRDPVSIRLSPMAANEGLIGKWYAEFPEDASEETKENLIWASVGNSRAFWPTKGQLLQKLRDAGFEAIYEQYDFIDDLLTDRYIEDNHRSLFIAVK
jgi:SAM-dependent methyltransferase